MCKGRIIACLDLKDGRVVKGVNFKGIADCGDPLDLVELYSRSGCAELMLYDISASGEKRKFSVELLSEIAPKATIPFGVGGGIGSLADIEEVLARGASKVSINSAALENPGFLQQASTRFGSKRITLAMDVARSKQFEGRWKVFSRGGTENTGFDAILWALEAVRLGAGELVVNSIDGDGTKVGYDLELISTLAKWIEIPIIASGGAGKLEHFSEAIRAGADGVLAASVFHYGETKIADLKAYLEMQEMGAENGN